MYLIVLIALLIVAPSCRQETVPEAPKAADLKPNGKVSGDLLALQEEYALHGQAGSGKFAPANAAVQMNGNRVVIDAVATGDGVALGRDLASIGASEISVYDRTVSAQLPIEAIEKLEGLKNLKSARASYGQLR